MSMSVPHFDLPFRWGRNGHAEVVEQDTLEDVANCVLAILLTFKGQRQELPDFGIDDPTFESQPIDLAALTQAILEQEPRAVVMMDQHPDEFNQLVADVAARVSTAQEVSRT